jgi:hypothetical protein
MQPQVTAKELNRMIETKRIERTSTFSKIADLCQARVIKYAKRDMHRCAFEVPEFILGTPPYDLNLAIKYVVERLEKNGFLVRYFFPRLLYISWDADEIEGKKQMFPLPHGATPPSLPALMPPPPKMQNTSQVQAHTHTQAHPAVHPHSPFLPPPMSTSRPPVIKSVSHDILMPHMPSLELPLPVSTSHVKPTQTQPKAQNTQPVSQKVVPPPQGTFFKSIADFKPSGKFVLNLN